MWDSTASIEQLATQTERVYYTGDRAAFREFPPSLLEQCWAALADDAFDEPAFLTLTNVYRALWELRSDWQSGGALKRLIDLSSVSASYDPTLLGKALVESRWLRDGYRRISGRPLPDTNSLTAEPAGLIEKAFPRLGLAVSDYLMAALLISGYRGMLLSVGDLWVYTALLALREARFFFLAQQPDVAMSSINWAEGRMAARDDFLDPAVRVDVGDLYLELAHCERASGRSDAQLPLLQQAQAFLKNSPVGLARAYYWEAECLLQQEKLYEALTSYDRALACGSTDRELLQIAQLQRQSILARCEGKLEAPEILFSEGLPEHLPLPEVREFFAAQQAGNATLELARSAAAKLKAAIDEARRTGWIAERNLLSLYLVWLKLALSAHEPLAALDRGLQEAELYVSSAPDEDVLQFRMLCKHLASRRSTPPAPLKLDQNKSRLRLKPRVGRSSGPPDNDMTLDLELVRRIERLPTPEGRLQTIQLALNVFNADKDLVGSDLRCVPLPQLIAVTQAAFQQLQRNEPTAEAALFQRHIGNEIIGQLGEICLFRAGYTEKYKRFRRRIEQDDDPGLHQAVESYYCLLWSTSHWLVDQYASVPLNRLVDALRPDHRALFASLASQLTEAIADVVVDDAEIAGLILDVRRLRCLAQLAGSSSHEAAGEFALPCPHDAAQVFLCGAERGRLIGVARRGHNYAIWHSAEARSLAERYSQIPKDQAGFAQLDSIFTAFMEDPSNHLESLLEEDDSPLRRIAFCDLTGLDFPLAWVGDSEGSYPITQGRLGERETSFNLQSVEFWGWSQEHGRPHFEVDDASRVLAIPELELRLSFPAVPTGQLFDGQAPGTLPLVHYEQWLLADVCKSASATLVSHLNEAATRSSFLRRGKERRSVVHISCHALSSPVAERTYLCLSRELGQPDGSPVTFLDVLLSDWSTVDLVFLNACVGSVGTPQIGESPLSLAWAFRAAGAAAVIATRWEVRDQTAWEFARCFYAALASQPPVSLERAFLAATRALRCDPRYGQPHDWGAFALLM